MDSRRTATMRKRGTILLMVIGVLALMAIMAVAYATLGRADKATGVTATRQREVVDQTGRIAEYLAGVIGDGALATYTEAAPAAVQGFTGTPAAVSSPAPYYTRRKMFDYPSTDAWMSTAEPNKSSQPKLEYSGAAMPAGLYKFDPAGSYDAPWDGATNTADDRSPSTPFLASIEPVWLFDPGNVPTARTPWYRDLHSWQHISNFAPSGNFVNLANLRNNFEARPGFWTYTVTAGGQDYGMMSFGLTLFDDAGVPYNPVGPNNAISPGTPATPTLGNVLLYDGSPAVPNIPAHWCSNLQRSFRPAVDARYAPEDYRHLFNSWADTDGDGVVDARWFEPADISRLFVTGGAPKEVKNILPSDGRMRWFVAARCIDASGLINVNTAGDIQWPTGQVHVSGSPDDPDQFFVLGASPFEIDLRRLLTLVDMRRSYGAAAPPAAPQPGTFGYNDLPQPHLVAPVPTSFSGYDWTRPSSGPSRAELVGQSGYASLRLSLVAPTPTPGPAVQHAEYDPAGAAPVVDPTKPYEQAPLSTPLRLETYELFGYPRSGVGFTGLVTGSYANAQRLVATPFTFADEYELRKFNGVNDDNTLSRLETVLDGRYRLNPTFSTFGPMRSARARSLELSFRTREFLPHQNPSGSDVDIYGGGGDSDTALFAALADVRHLITTFNGSRPLIDSPALHIDPAGNKSPAPLRDIDGTIPQAPKVAPQRRTDAVGYDASADINTIRPGSAVTTAADRDKIAAAVNRIFDAYARALAPWSEQPSTWAWPSTAATTPNAYGRAYGGSSELAMRAAAHLAVNAADMADADRLGPSLGGAATDPDGLTPTAMTLCVSQLAAQNAEADQSADTIFKLPWPFLRLPDHTRSFDDEAASPSADPYLRHFRPPATGPSGNLANPPTGVDERVTVFGIEPQPFLTQVSAYYIVTDTPSIAQEKGDDEFAEVDPLDRIVTFEPRYSMQNPDFLCEILAFQLHNPFDTRVVLFQAGGVVPDVRYYLEYATQSFALARQSETANEILDETIELEPGETRVFYSINPGLLDDVVKRFDNAEKDAPGGSTFTTDNLKDALKAMFGADSVMIPMVTSTNFSALPLTPTNTGTPAFGTVGERDLWGLNAVPPADPRDRHAVYLWRVLRSNNGGGSDDSGSGTANDPRNDLLADRLRDPTVASGSGGNGYLLDGRDSLAGSGTVKVNGTDAGDDSAGSSSFEDNKGFTAVSWWTIRRARGQNTAGNGMLPPSVLEARGGTANNFYGIGGSRSLNLEDDEDTIAGSPTKGDFSSTGGTGESHFEKLRDLKTVTDIGDIELGDPLHTQNDNPITTYNRLGNAGLPKYAAAAIEFIGGGLFQPMGSSDYQAINTALFSRPGDFLLPLCVGPEYYPDRTPAGSTRAEELEAKWLTLGEALAIAAGYYSPTSPNDLYHQYARDFRVESGNPADVRGAAKCDRGHLVLDAWSPYHNFGSNRIRPVGTGVPLALGVLDQFRTAYGVCSTDGEFQIRAHAYGHEKQSVAGKLNLNTAPTNNFRCLPLVSPAGEFTPPWDWQTNAGWDSAANAVPPPDPSGVIEPLYDALIERFDIGAAMQAYRDKILGFTRPLEGKWMTDAFTSGGPAPLDFLDRPGAPNRGRRERTKVLNIREQPGFKSLGEILAVNLRGTDFTFSPANGGDRDNSIMRFGAPDPTLPGLAISEPGITGVRHLLRDASTGKANITNTPFEPARAANTYAQKIAIANAVSNVATVRSDTFIVWFLVHGYTQQDTIVAAGEPMVPTLKKRFMMIVDRSNVTKKGDKPRIALLREVPVE